MRVVATRKFYQNDIDFLKASLPNVDFIFGNEVTNDFLLDQCSIGVDVFLGSPPSKEILIESLPRLKLIQIPWAGVESISFDDVSSLNIPCANSHSNSVVVAEMAISLLFELLKKVALHDRDLRSGIWHRPGDESGFYPPIKLSGSKVGFFGYGAINQSVHKMLSGFDIRFTACVNTPRAFDNIEEVFSPKELGLFLSGIDILFVGAPLTPLTNGIFDVDVMNNMKKNAFIVNVSRAKLFKESDLFDLLRSNSIAGAAMDVWWRNPARGSSSAMPSLLPFNDLDNVVLSPHRSGYSSGALPHLDGALENIARVSQGLQPENLIDLSRGY